MPNLPPWGAGIPLIGNNPFIIAVPRSAGHVVLDMAVSQFSYGAVAGYASRGEELPVPGGYDAEGRLTTDAKALEATGRHLPIGYWKGSGISILLDMTAALLSGGLATDQIAPDPNRESGVSQIFMAFDLEKIRGSRDAADAEADRIIAFLKQGGAGVRYPGEGSLKSRRESMELGVEVDEAIWKAVLEMSAG